MKQRIIGIVLFAVLVAVSGQAMAAQGGNTLDASLLLASSPLSGYDDTIGLGVGATIDMSGRMHTSSKNMKMGIRADMAYFDWDGNFFGFGVDYKRLAFFGGPRITFLTGNAPIEPYVEGGLELTYDDIGVYTAGFGASSSTGFSLGLAGGGGVDFKLAPNVKLGVNGRLHLISDSFMTVGVTLGFLF